MYWDDLHVGSIFETRTRTIGSDDIALFARLSGDDNPLHLDSEFAATTRYQKPIAHGLLIMSIVSGLAVESGTLGAETTALTSVAWRFRRPVFAGDTIHARMNVQKVRSVPRTDSGLAIFAVQVVNQDNDIVQSGSWQTLVQRRAARDPD